MPKITIFKAKKIITMDPNQPQATHVGVKDGRIIFVGDEEQINLYDDYTLDERFAKHVLTPGFVEGHGHAMEGQVWNYPYVGYQDRYSPQGEKWQGSTSITAIIERLQEYEKSMQDAQQTLHAWGLDPIYFSQRLNTEHLDQISTQRPIIIMHSNGHLINVNSKVLELAGITADTDVEGIIKDAQGNPTGELGEMATMYMAYKNTDGGNPFFENLNNNILKQYAQAASNVGVTTATDLYANFDEHSLKTYQEAAMDEDFSIRIVPAINTLGVSTDEGIAIMQKLKKQQNPLDKLHYGLCKIMTDGSIQGFTARMQWPGYHNGAANGMWNMPPEQLTDTVIAYHKAGMHLHIHTSGICLQNN